MNPVYIANEPARVDVDAMREPTVIEFGAPWCPICQGAQPLIEQAFANRDSVQHIKVEDGKGQPLGRSFRVKLWPTLIFMREGQELARVVRPTTVEQIEQGFASIA